MQRGRVGGEGEGVILVSLNSVRVWPCSAPKPLENLWPSSQSQVPAHSGRFLPQPSAW